MTKRIKRCISIGLVLTVISVPIFLVSSCSSDAKTETPKEAPQTKLTSIKKEKTKIKINGITLKNSENLQAISREMFTANPINLETISLFFNGINQNNLNNFFDISIQRSLVKRGCWNFVLQAKEGFVFSQNIDKIESNPFYVNPSKVISDHTNKEPEKPVEIPKTPSKIPENVVVDPKPDTPLESPPSVLVPAVTEEPKLEVPTIPKLITELTRKKVIEFEWHSVERITQEMFQEKMPQVTSIGHSAFQNTELKYIEIPNTVTEIKSEAFIGCQLESLILPRSVKKIGLKAFKECGLTNLNIPSSVEIIESGAFYGNNITQIFIHKTMKKIGSEAFASNKIKSWKVIGTADLAEDAFINQRIEPKNAWPLWNL